MATFEIFTIIQVAAEDKFARGDDGIVHYTRVTHVPHTPNILGKERQEEMQWVPVRLIYCTEAKTAEEQEVDASSDLVT